MTTTVQEQLQEFLSLCIIEKHRISSPVLWNMNMTGKNKSAKYFSWYAVIESSEDLPKILTIAINEPERITSSGKLYTCVEREGGAKTVSQATSISSGKNLEKKNATCALTQAILQARTLYNNRIKKGCKLNKSDLTTLVTLDTLVAENNWRVFPMALHDYNKGKNADKIKFPCWIQPKYDGIRILALYHAGIPGEIDIWSRGRKNFDRQEEISSALKDLLKNFPGCYIDGELWKTGYGLQVISGSSRRKNNESIELQCWIFDAFYMEKKQGFSERVKILDALKDLNKSPLIKFAPTELVKGKEVAMKKYKDCLDANLEGAVLRNTDSLYEFGINKELRSRTTLKLKPRDDDEWELIGFNSGSKGKDVGALIWILRVSKEGVKNHAKKYGMKLVYPPEEDAEFTCAPNLTYEQRYKAYKLLQDPEIFLKFKGKLMRVQFSILSEYGKPQQPRVLGFADLLLNEKFLHML